MNRLSYKPGILLFFGMLLTASPGLFANGRQTLSSGASHTLIIGENNSLWGWGGNGSGQVGDGTTLNQLEPVLISDTNDWKYVSAAGDHSLALKTDGTLWGWGDNSSGQLGDGTTVSKLVPTQIGTDTDWVAAEAGSAGPGAGFSIALKADGRAFAWGDNSGGQLAQNPFNIQQLLVPTQVGGGEAFSDIAAGGIHVLAIRTDGSLFGWGNNSANQLGLGNDSKGLFITIPKQIGTATDWAFIESEGFASFAIKSGGQLFSWGSSGLLGFGNSDPSKDVPTQVGTQSDWKELSASGGHILAVKTDGKLLGWGNNVIGQLGFPRFDDFGNPIIDNFIKELPTELLLQRGWASVATGETFSAVLGNDGVVFTFGDNTQGQLGNGTLINSDLITSSFFGIPDLVLNNIGFQPSDPVSGETLNVNVFIGNIGTKTVSAGAGILLDIRLSPDNVFDADDIVLQTPTGQPILVNDAIGSTLSITFPVDVDLPASIDSGTYFLVARVDANGVVEETIEETATGTNNEGASAASLDFLPDITVEIDEAGLAGTTVLGGDSISFNVTLRNEGGGNLVAGTNGSFDLRVFLSEDNFPGNAGDVILVDALAVTSGLNVGQPRVLNLVATVPRSQPVGSFRVIAVADSNDDVVESDENNNTDFTAGQVITVQGIPLEEAIDDPVLVRENEAGGADTFVLDLSSSGDGIWFGQTDFFFIGEGAPLGNSSAAESPPLLIGQQSTLETVIPGPSRITFYWKSQTNNESNFLKFTIDGTEPAEGGRITGIVPFTKASFILPAETNTVAWTYVQGSEPDGTESTFLDFVTVEPLTGFDLVIDNVELQGSGPFVPQQDLIQIVVLARNQGIILPIPDDFIVSVTLSLDQVLGNEDDIRLADLTRFSDFLNEDDRFGYSPTLPIPDTVTVNEKQEIIPAGDYFLIVKIDSTDLVNESDEENNIFISPTNNVRIEPRPNLEPVTLNFVTAFPTPETDPEPELILFGDRVILTFSIRNTGLAINTSPFKLQVVLSDDPDFGSPDDFVFFSVTETTGLPVGQTRNYQFSRQVPPDTPIGETFFMGLVVDAEDKVVESNEADNTLGSPENNLIFSEFTVAQGVGTVENGFSPNIRNSNLPGVDAPFFAQSLETFDGEAAAQSVDITDNQVAGFEFDIDNPDGPSVISFAWKVESERALTSIGTNNSVLKFDTLDFLIDGVVAKFISGTEPDIDWMVESFEIPQGIHTVRWEYRKDGSVTVPRDAAWVDRIQITSPDLAFLPDAADPLGDPGIKLITTPPTGGFTSGADLAVQLRFTNLDVAEVRSTPPFSIQIRLSPDPQFDEEDSQVKNDLILDTFSYSLGVQPGEVVDLVRNVQIPLNLAVADNFRLAARLDFLNIVPESREENNTVLSSSATLTIQPNINLNTALDFEAPFGWETGGDSTWFGQNNVFAPPSLTAPGNNSAVEASPIGVGQETFLETQLTTLTDPALPALVSFYWKVSSIQNFNFLRFLISDIEQARISGDVDWNKETFFVPAGTQTVQWAYTKTSGDEEVGILDTGWVDFVAFTPVTQPDLLIKSLEVVPGVYILDRGDDIDKDKLPIRVVAENRGTEIPDTFTFVPSDIELRLSADSVWGNDDDISLGKVAVIQQTQGDAGLQIVFEGDILIPNTTPAGDYFVAAFIDFNDRIDEYEPEDFIPFTATDNNFAVTSTSSVTVKRLPDLVLENVQLDDTKIHFPEGALSVSFDIRNRGLEATDGSAIFNQKISLFALSAFSTLFDDFGGQLVSNPLLVNNFTGNSIPIDVLSDFPENAFLPGVDAFNPNGGKIQVKAELILPTLEEIQMGLPGELPDIELESYFLVIELDSANRVEESNEQNTFVAVFPFRIFFEPAGPEGFNAWATRNGLNPIDPTLDPDGDGLINLEEYAIDSNPQVADTNGKGLLQNAGLTVFENVTYLSLTFDLNIFASDLLYFVEVSSDGINFTPLLTIEPPFLDDTGPTSLNGNSGLNSDPLVLSITERGLTARLTVRDNVPADSVDQRFMRLKVQED